MKELEAQSHPGRPSSRRQLLYAGVVGVFVGILAVIYLPLVRITQNFSLDVGKWGAAHWYGWLIVPIFSGFLGMFAAALADRFAPEASGGGLVHIKGALLGVRVLDPLRLIPTKFLGSISVFIGGLGVGPEAPSIQMGGALGQLVGQIFKLDRQSTRPLIAAGAGAGFAAVFNAPLAGFIFVLEELRKELSSVTYGTALVASIAADFLVRIVYGQGYSYFFASHTGALPMHTLPVALVIGLAGGFIGFGFKRMVLGAQTLRKKLRISKLAIGCLAGGAMGIIIMTLPELSGSGQNSVNELFAGHGMQLFLGAYVLLCFGRLLVTVVCHNAEAPGGILVPILAFGAYLGIFFAKGMTVMIPSYHEYLFGLMTIGMAATLSAVIRSPLTCTVLVVEVTHEYGLLYALLVGTFASYAVGEWLHDEPIDDYLLERDLHDESKRVNSHSSILEMELTVESGSGAHGTAIKDLNLPVHTVISRITRGDRIFVPNGSTVLDEGDMLQIAVDVNHPSDALVIERMMTGA